jgi:hypothetical protein
VLRHLPGQNMIIRSKLLGSRIAVPAPFRAAALAARQVASRPKPKSIEEQELEWDYDQILHYKKPEGKMDQLAKWLSPHTISAAINFGFVGCVIFYKVAVKILGYL